MDTFTQKEVHLCILWIVIVAVRSSVMDECLSNSMKLESECSISLKPKTLILGSERDSVCVMKQSIFDTLSGRYPYVCYFRVSTVRYMGLFAVIQNMNLRKDSETGECIDYVAFRPYTRIGLLNNQKAEWTHYCGEMNVSSESYLASNSSELLPFGFDNPSGETEVKVYVRNITIPRVTVKLDLRIAFTAYQSCSSSSGNYKKCSPKSCIWTTFFNDQVLNCPYRSCSDERSCDRSEASGDKPFIPSAGLATTVMVAAVAGVFTMFFVFAVFLWMLRHLTDCCMRRTPARDGTRMRRVSTNEDMRPSAPPESPSLDKDLPPSYDSLFPGDAVGSR